MTHGHVLGGRRARIYCTWNVARAVLCRIGSQLCANLYKWPSLNAPDMCSPYCTHAFPALRCTSVVGRAWNISALCRHDRIEDRTSSPPHQSTLSSHFIGRRSAPSARRFARLQPTGHRCERKTAQNTRATMPFRFCDMTLAAAKETVPSCPSSAIDVPSAVDEPSANNERRHLPTKAST